MKLNKASLFALYAVLELANDPENKLSTIDIAAKYGISANHLAKVMRHLIHEGLVVGQRGSHGGCSFAGSAYRTTLLDVIQLFENCDPDSELTSYSESAGGPIVAELQKISREIEDLSRSVLGSVTLATALKNTRNSPIVPVSSNAALFRAAETATY